MDDKLNEQIPEVTEEVVAEEVIEEQQKETSTSEQKKEYTDPNEGVFTSKPNTGRTAENYSYGQHSGENNSYTGYNYQNNQSSQFNQYQQPQQQWESTPLSMGEWLLTILIGMVPCVGLVIYCVWAFGSSGNLNRKNYCRAYLIIQAISIVLGAILAMFTAMFSFMLY